MTESIGTIQNELNAFFITFKVITEPLKPTDLVEPVIEQWCRAREQYAARGSTMARWAFLHIIELGFCLDPKWESKYNSTMTLEGLAELIVAEQALEV